MVYKNIYIKDLYGDNVSLYRNHQNTQSGRNYNIVFLTV